MRKPVFITGEEAAAMIADNATVATIGMTLVSAAETILKAIEQRFFGNRKPQRADSGPFLRAERPGPGNPAFCP